MSKDGLGRHSERRVLKLAEHVLASSISPLDSQSPIKPSVVTSTIEDGGKDKQTAAFLKYRGEFSRASRKLRQDGVLPPMTVWELQLLSPSAGRITGSLDKLLDEAESSGRLNALHLLPGPWMGANTRQDKLKLLEIAQVAQNAGSELHLCADYQMMFGDDGLSSNIVVPTITLHSPGYTLDPTVKTSVAPDAFRVHARVVIANPEDSEKISRFHLSKEPNFGLFQDSIISTTDNDHWRKQRQHLTEVFLPLSSLGKIMPVSLARAKKCAGRLRDLTSKGKSVDMNDFLLHETQAQLQLALLGASEETMNATNTDIRRTFGGHPEAHPGRLSDAIKQSLERAWGDKDFGLPSDGCPVRGPLSRAFQTGGMHPSTDYGNMHFSLFAGHDTTGHTLTWFMFEMGRNPDIQRQVQREVDCFFERLAGEDPTYTDLRHFEFLDRCITETLRLWPAVAAGTYRQLQSPESVRGAGGAQVLLPKGTFVNVTNWSRHRNPRLWGPDSDQFNPNRDFDNAEIAHVGCPLAAKNPQSSRFSPFAYNPRSCLGKNFAQMEMRLIIAYLLRDFDFTLAPPYDQLLGKTLGAVSSNDPPYFRGVNRTGTMGPLDLKSSQSDRPFLALNMHAYPRCTLSNACR